MKHFSRYEQMREACNAFHKAHPEVWDLFVKFTFDRINRGFKHYTARGIFKRITWDTDKPEKDEENTFKLNNNHSPFYARRFMRMYPEHDGFFRTRRQISHDEAPSPLPELGPDYFDAA